MSMRLSSVPPQLAGDTMNKRQHPQTQLAKSQIVKFCTKHDAHHNYACTLCKAIGKVI
jgi:hypothetical protein